MANCSYWLCHWLLGSIRTEGEIARTRTAVAAVVLRAKGGFSSLPISHEKVLLIGLGESDEVF